MGAIGSYDEAFHTGPDADPHARQEHFTFRIVLTHWSGYGPRDQYELRLAVSEDLARDAVNAKGFVEHKIDKLLANAKRRFMQQIFGEQGGTR